MIEPVRGNDFVQRIVNVLSGGGCKKGKRLGRKSKWKYDLWVPRVFSSFEKPY